MTEKSKNWLYLALIMTLLWGTGTKYEIFYTKMWDIKLCSSSENFMQKYLLQQKLFKKMCWKCDIFLFYMFFKEKVTPKLNFLIVGE